MTPPAPDNPPDRDASAAVASAGRAAPDAVLLAAGQGTRMGSDLPKVLHEVAGIPMIRWVVRACRQAGVRRCIVVVGYRGDLVRQALADERDIKFVEQHEQLGTGHAAMMAGPKFLDQDLDVFVLCGDGPLIRPATLTTVLDTHRATGAAATLATATLENPDGYGRVLRDSAGGFDRIVEQKDATPEQLAVCEVNPSYYCFRSGDLFTQLANLRNDNAQGEFYLTDVPAMLKSAGQTVTVVDAVPAGDVLSINTPEQLAEVDVVLRRRLAESDGTNAATAPTPHSPEAHGDRA